MVGTTSFEYDRFVKYVHRNIERPLETLARVETKKLPTGVPAKFPGPPGLQFCVFPVLHLTLFVFVVVLDCLPVWWARFDTSASLVDWFPLHTVVLICFLAFASVNTLKNDQCSYSRKTFCRDTETKTLGLRR